MADQVAVEIRLGDADDAAGVAARLAELGADDVSVAEEQGLVDLLPYVVTGLVALAGLTDVLASIRGRRRCQQIIDVRGKTITSTVDCSVRDGRLIIVAKGGKVTIHEPGRLLDLTKVIETALQSGAKAAHDAVAAAAPDAELTISG
jgi:hypothetical protein